MRKGREKEARCSSLGWWVRLGGGSMEKERALPRRETRRTLGTPDPERTAWAVRALRGYKALSLLGSWRASPTDRSMES